NYVVEDNVITDIKGTNSMVQFYGIYFSAVNSGSTTSNGGRLYVSRNIVEKIPVVTSTSYGIYSSNNQAGCEFVENKVRLITLGSSSVYFYRIYTTSTTRMDFLKNEVTDITYANAASYFNEINLNSPTLSVISNNLVNKVSGSGTIFY